MEYPTLTAVKGCISSILHLEMVVKNETQKVPFFTTKCELYLKIFIKVLTTIFFYGIMLPVTGAVTGAVTVATKVGNHGKKGNHSRRCGRSGSLSPDSIPSYQ